ncbi:polyphosphate kinase 2 family protein [Humidisolicoccus flavus]|uniref:polyphosphate kinase 2 family protein n=1 Tax=Humidisolicoccus flavus TaxID=3111414 RepID=UPI00324EF5FD
MDSIADALRVTGPEFSLADHDPNATPGFTGKKSEGRALLEERTEHLAELQEKLFAASRIGASDRVLLVLQGMDTSGKGGILRHVVGAVDPQGVQIHAFKSPTKEELAHDFLWRIRRELPGPGMIGVFDRSHYEDVLIHRVRGLSTPAEIEERYGIIQDFEASLAENGIQVVKAMLHISKEEQGERLLERLDRPEKHWKFNPGDIDEREHWEAYQEAYQIAIERTATPISPWHVVPANRKWFARLAVQSLVIEALERINPQWPEADFDVAHERARLLELGAIGSAE